MEDLNSNLHGSKGRNSELESEKITNKTAEVKM